MSLKNKIKPSREFYSRVLDPKKPTRKTLEVLSLKIVSERTHVHLYANSNDMSNTASFPSSMHSSEKKEFI